MQTIAMAFPIPTDKLPALRHLSDQLKGERRHEFEDFLQRLGVDEERWYLQSIGGTQHCIMFLAAEDITGAFAQLANSKHSFDQWMKDRNRDIFGIDFEAPSDEPMPESLLEHPVGRASRP